MRMRPEAEDQFFFSRSSRPPSISSWYGLLASNILVKSKKAFTRSNTRCNNCFLEHVPSRSLNLGSRRSDLLCGEERRRVPTTSSLSTEFLGRLAEASATLCTYTEYRGTRTNKLAKLVRGPPADPRNLNLNGKSQRGSPFNLVSSRPRRPV